MDAGTLQRRKCGCETQRARESFSMVRSCKGKTGRSSRDDESKRNGDNRTLGGHAGRGNGLCAASSRLAGAVGSDGDGGWQGPRTAVIAGEDCLDLLRGQGFDPAEQGSKRRHHGARQNAGHKENVVIFAVADVSSYDFWPARGFVKDAIRQEEKKSGTPIYLDWNGSSRTAFGFQAGSSNLVLLNADNTVKLAHCVVVPQTMRETILRVRRVGLDADHPVRHRLTRDVEGHGLGVRQHSGHGRQGQVPQDSVDHLVPPDDGDRLQARVAPWARKHVFMEGPPPTHRATRTAARWRWPPAGSSALAALAPCDRARQCTRPLRPSSGRPRPPTGACFCAQALAADRRTAPVAIVHARRCARTVRGRARRCDTHRELRRRPWSCDVAPGAATSPLELRRRPWSCDVAPRLPSASRSPILPPWRRQRNARQAKRRPS